MRRRVKVNLYFYDGSAVILQVNIFFFYLYGTRILCTNICVCTYLSHFQMNLLARKILMCSHIINYIVCDMVESSQTLCDYYRMRACIGVLMQKTFFLGMKFLML